MSGTIRQRLKRFVAIAGVLVLVGGGAFLASRPGAAPSSAYRRVELRYSFRVNNLNGAAPVTAWLPMPLTSNWQVLENYAVASAWKYSIVADAEFGNKFLRFDITSGEDRSEAVVTFVVSRRAITEADERGEQGKASSPKRFLAADSLVPIDGAIAEEAGRIAGGESDPMQQARRLYDHIVESVKYGKTGEGWGQGDALYACDVRTGNCTDFHSLFIGEARSLGLPSRFVIGFSLPPPEDGGVISGYHCWAEFHVDGVGWMPLDASEAHKNPGRRDDLFGRLDADRVAFTVGRDIVLPGSATGSRNYLVYPHVEVAGRVHREFTWEVSCRDI